MPAIYLTENDVTELLDMSTAIELVTEGFRQIATGEAVNRPRQRARAKGVILHTMSAASDVWGCVGYKAYITTNKGARFHVCLYSQSTGELEVMIEADQLGQIRTGAASGVATDYMARPDAAVVGCFGTGKQARTQLQAICTVRRIERVDVYGRNPDRQEDFADEMSEICETEVIPVHSPDETASEKDIVITATSSKEPVFRGEMLADGTHVNAIGSNFITKAELDIDAIRQADIIVCDDVEQCKVEAGDLKDALESGVTDWALMHDLADVVTGHQTGRAHADQITIFESVGLAIEDLAVAQWLLAEARKEDVGRPLPF